MTLTFGLERRAIDSAEILKYTTLINHADKFPAAIAYLRAGPGYRID